MQLKQKLKTFPHGIHPPEHKEQTCNLPIQRFPFAPLLVIPLLQHIGKAAIPVVREGQEVVRGELLARADGFLSAPIHAPASGVVKHITLLPSISGQMVPGIYLEPWPGSTQEIIEGQPCDVDQATAEEIISAIQNAGIVGLGGAAFPTHAKLIPPEGHHIDTLLINGVECEPYLTTDHRVMLEQSEDIMLGIRYVLKASGAPRAIIAVEANKMDAVEKLNSVIPKNAPISVEVLAVKYPQGAEKILIKALLDREVPAGEHSSAVHVLGINVATCAEIGRLLPHGRGIQERVITISGPALKQRGNFRIPIGTPARFVLEQLGVSNDLSQVFLGGPMMGNALPSLDVPITKGTSGLIAYTERESGPAAPIYPCIHCGACVDACPVFINPSQLGLLAKQNDFASMSEHHLKECFECGACSYVCPSHIPLVQQFRSAKAYLKKNRAA
jgi:electron transport complex protein RnfC